MERRQVNRLFLDAMGLHVARSPHFVLDGRGANDYLKQLIDGGQEKLFLPTNEKAEPILPFSELLVEFKFDDGDQWYYLKVRDHVLGVFMITPILAQDDSNNYLVTILGVKLRPNSECVVPGEDIKYGLFAFRWLTQQRVVLPEDMLKEYIKASHHNRTLSYLGSFMGLASHPSHSIVQRFPKEKKNDIIWILSRSHYLIIDNDESKTISHSGITRSFDGTITRAMHARRAHFRTLRHERFKANIGKRVWVRSCWVGPKEWEGTDAKIYRVVTSEKTELVAAAKE